MANKKKKDPLAAAAKQVVKDTAKQTVKQTAPKKTAQQKVQNVAKKAAGNVVKNKAPGTVKKSQPKTTQFKASNVSSVTGRSTNKQDRAQTSKTLANKVQAKKTAKSKVTGTQRGEFRPAGNAVERNVLSKKSAPTKLSKTDDLLLNQRGRNEVENAKLLWEAAKKNGDPAMMKIAHGMAELSRLNNSMNRLDDGTITGPYSGGTWGDRAIEASMADLNTAQTGLKQPRKNLLKSEAYQVKSALNEAGAGYLNTLDSFPASLPKGQTSSQLLVPDDRASHEFARRGTSAYTEEDLRRAADEMTTRSQAQMNLGYQTTPINGTLGKFIGDATRVGTGIGIDLAANTIIPGAGLANMGARTWGNIYQQARQEQRLKGIENEPYANLKAYMYATAMTGVEVGTERMFDGLKIAGKSVYGSGALTSKMGRNLDEVLDAGIKRAAARLSKTEGGEIALNALMNIGKSGLEEGMEELVADFLQWQMPRIYGGDTESAKETLSNALYDFALGAAMGGFGGVTSIGSSARESRGDQFLRARMMDLGATEEDAIGVVAETPTEEKYKLFSASDEELSNWAKDKGIISRERANQSLVEASEEQSSEQTFAPEQTVQAEQPVSTVSKSKAKDALRRRLRESGIRDEATLKAIMQNMSAEEMDEASKLRKNDFLEWRDRVMEPGYRREMLDEEPETENVTANIPQNVQERTAPTERIEITEEPSEVDDIPSREQVARAMQTQSDLLKEQRIAEQREEEEADTIPVRKMSVNEIYASSLGKAGRNAYVTLGGKYRSSELYFAEAISAYNAGFSGNPLQTLGNKVINRKQAVAMWEAGRIDRTTSVNAREENQRHALVYDKKSSGFFDDDVAREQMDAKTIKSMKKICKALGIRGFYVESIKGFDPETKQSFLANGSYNRGILLLSQNMDPDKTIEFVFGHEITHRMAETSPKAYESLKKYVMSQDKAKDSVQAVIDDYRRGGSIIDYDTAVEEAVADYVGLMINNHNLLEQFARNIDRNTLQKFLDALKTLLAKLKANKLAAEEAEVQAAINQIEKFMKQSVKDTKRIARSNRVTEAQMGKEAFPGEEAGGKFSLMEFPDGTRFVDVQTDQEQFDGLSKKEKGILAEKIIRKRFMGKVIGLENRAFVNAQTASEYRSPANKRLDNDVYDAKMRASTELDNLLDAGTNFRTKPDGEYGHTHPNMVGDFRLFDTIFKVGREYYKGVVNIMPVKKGLLLKDITKIKNITEDLYSSYGGEPQAAFLRDASMDSINQQEPKSKRKYSLRVVKPIEPNGTQWKRGATFDEVKAEHPTLFELASDESDVRNPTQIKGTVKTYRKIYDMLKDEGFDGTILDASSGFGVGTEAGRNEYGFKVDDIEPFPEKDYKPRYTDYSRLNKQYDVVISNAVLNVLPQDLRDAMVVKIGELLAPGGRAFVNVRGADVKNAGSKVPIDESQMEYFISNTGSYQKGFRGAELVAYLQDALGDVFVVTPAKGFGAVSAMVTKKDRSSTRYSIKKTKAEEKRDRGEKLTESQFYQVYSAHIVNGGKTNTPQSIIDNIKTEGFKGDGGPLGANVMPTTVNNGAIGYTEEDLRNQGKSEKTIKDLKDNPAPGMWIGDRYYFSLNSAQRRYGSREGQTVLLVPRSAVDKNDKIKQGFKPFDYEILTVERDFQPYYELYSKAYDEYKSSGAKFSIRRSPETSRNLVALHNLTEDKLLKSIENGGFPMPSIAVTKADVEHSNFGPITLLMGRETIDPEADSRNKVYSADVWSPTFPNIEYEPDEKAEKRLRDKYYELEKEYGRDVVNALYPYGVTLEDAINRNGGVEGILAKEKDNIGMKKVFLADKGIDVPEDVYTVTTKRMDDGEIRDGRGFIEQYGVDNMERAEAALSNRETWKEFVKENADEIADAYGKHLKKEFPGEDFSEYVENLSNADLLRIVRRAAKVKNGDVETQTRTYDADATNKAINDAVNQKEYEVWLEDLFSGVEKSRGIYNNTDFYTPSGNRRSFKQTHFEVTLENIVRAMATQRTGTTKNTSGFHGAKTVRAASAKQFRSVDEMHQNEEKLQNRTSEEAEKLNDEMNNRLSGIINQIYDLTEHSEYENRFIEFDRIGEIILEVAETGRITPSNVKNIFAKYQYDMPKNISDEVARFIKDTQDMPVNIFEAKPERVVGLDEIVSAIIPDDSSDRLVSALNENGIPVQTYIRDDNASRVQAVNETADKYEAKFSRRSDVSYEELMERYGVIKPGEGPRRDVSVPRQTTDDDKVSQFIRTAMEAKRTPEGLLPTIKEMIASGDFSFQSLSNEVAFDKAVEKIEKIGFDKAWDEWKEKVGKGVVSLDMTAMGYALYDATIKSKQFERSGQVLVYMAKNVRNAAQALQAVRILKMLPPEIQLSLIPEKDLPPDLKKRKKELDRRAREEYEGEDAEPEYDEDGNEIPKKPRKKGKPTQREVDDLEEDIAEYDAKHAKSTLMDMWNAWRYLAMLFNARTHIRNIIGNAGFFPVVMSKNATATAAEIALYYTIGKRTGMQRTKGFFSHKQFSYGWKDYNSVKSIIMQEKYEGQEYDDNGEKVFRGILAPLEKPRKLNSAALNIEDQWFSQPHYAIALAQYMAANGITAEMMETGFGTMSNGKEFTAAEADKARAYAIKEAQKGTYRDLNDLSSFFMRVGKPSNASNKVEKVVYVLIEGVIPFRKTPANILCRAMEYSPVGFAHGMWKLTYGLTRTHMIQQKVTEGKELTEKEKDFKPVTVAEALDRLCSGLSGTAIFALGMYLAKLGILVAKTDNGDDDQKYFTQLLGHQQWAIEVNGYSFTIDWLAPEVVPLFMGAQYFTGFREGDPIRNFSNLADSISMVIDPIMELSCMSGIQEALNNFAKFSEGDVNTMVSVGATLALSYFSQGIPTLFGQLERASQEQRMTTFTQDEQLIPANWQYQIGKISAKIPGWDYHQIPYVDSWGNTETETVLWKRIVTNMALPAYVKKIDTRPIAKELQRLYDATGDGGVLPKPGWKTYRYTDENGKGETVYLSEEEYLAYSRAKGRENFNKVNKFINSEAYKTMSDPDRAKVISDLYDYSEYKAQSENIVNFRREPYDWIVKYQEFSDAFGGYDVVDYVNVRRSTQDVKGLYDPNKPGSNAISNTSSAAKALAIYKSGAKIPTDPEQRTLFLDALGVNSKEVKTWNQAQTEEFMEKTKKKYGITD